MKMKDRITALCGPAAFVLVLAGYLLSLVFHDHKIYGYFVLVALLIFYGYLSRSCPPDARPDASCRTVYLFCLFLLALTFVAIFGFSPDRIAFHDDFLESYSMAQKGTEMLLQGGVFGWDARHLGGYPIAYSGATVVSFLYLPFYFLGLTGYALMILSLWLAFPLLTGRLACSVDDRPAVGARAVLYATAGFFFLLTQTAHWGNIHDLAGLDVLIAALVGYQRMKSRGGKNFFLFVLLGVLLVFTYLPYAPVLFLFLGLDWLLGGRDRRLLVRIAAAGVLVFLGALHYSWFLLKYGGYARGDFSHFVPVFAWRDEPLRRLAGAVRNIFSPGRYFLAVVFLLAPAVRGRKTRTLGALALCVLAFYLTGQALINADYVSRIMAARLLFLLPVLAAVIFAVWAVRRGVGLAFLLIILLAGFRPDYLYPKPTIRCLRDYDPQLVADIRRLDGNLILFENTKCRNVSDDGDPRWDAQVLPEGMKRHVHLAGMMAMETGKNFFSTTHSGWHETVWRGNALISGIYKGKMIADVPFRDIEGVLRHWGIRYLVLWSRMAKDYFLKHPDLFRRVAGDRGWAILEYRNADPRSVVLQQGSGDVVREDYFEKVLQIRGAVKGEPVVLRSNYFPAWRAGTGGRGVALYDADGQTGFISPASGDYTVRLYFPKYVVFSFLAFLSLGAAWGLSKKYFNAGTERTRGEGTP